MSFSWKTTGEEVATLFKEHIKGTVGKLTWHRQNTNVDTYTIPIV